METLTRDAIIDKIRDAGLVGAGGAGFPTHVKAGARADCVIANGAECEPLLSCDQAVMIRRAGAMLRGLSLLGTATGAEERIVAIKEKNQQAIQAVQDALGAFPDIRLRLMGDFYPAGDEVTLVYEVKGRIVPEGGIPPDVGVVVQNVATLVKIAEAAEGIPFTSRYVSVAGRVRNPATFEAPIGVSLEALIQGAGGSIDDQPFSLVVGGPCMGSLAAALDDPMTKTTTGLLVLPPDHPLVTLKSANLDQLLHRARSVCDQCRYCTDLCPRYLLGHKLEPHRIMTAIGWGNDLAVAELASAHLCCECGVCGLYSCPMELYPHLYIQQIKQQLNEAGIPRQKGSAPKSALQEYAERRLPTARLFSRLGLSEFPKDTPFSAESIPAERVRLLLHQQIGAASEPVVKKGARVKTGDRVAEIPSGALGAHLHASIDGTITEVTNRWIEIQAT